MLHFLFPTAPLRGIMTPVHGWHHETGSAACRIALTETYFKIPASNTHPFLLTSMFYESISITIYYHIDILFICIDICVHIFGVIKPAEGLSSEVQSQHS